MQPAGDQAFGFEGYTLDLKRGALRHGEREIELRPKSFAVLRYLVEHAGRLVSKDELAKAIWPDVVVTDESLTRCVSDVRTALDDGEQRIIKTLPRRGYRLAAPVSLRAPGAEATATDARPIAAPRLSIVVLPFANLGGDPEQDYFVDGVTESLTTDLSRISGSFVIGRNTAFTYKGKPFDVKQIGRELNVRYVLEGSVQRGGSRMRINVQLIDAETGNHLWAERFDKPLADLFDMQDEIVARLASALKTELVAAEASRAERTPHPDSMDLYFQGSARARKGETPEYVAQSRDFFDRALALDPGNIEALVSAAMVEVRMANNFLGDDRTAHFAAAEAILTKALSLAPNHALAHLWLGNVKTNTKRVVEGIAEIERALALDRNLAMAHAIIGLAKVYVGRAEDTEAHVEEAFRLSPGDSHSHHWMMFAGLAKCHLGADEEAVARCNRAIEINRNFPVAHFLLAAALAHLDRLDEARAAAQAGLALNPTFTVARIRAGKTTDDPAVKTRGRRVIDGMRMAGVPEG